METTPTALSELPVAQPGAGALAYPQGVPMGAPQLDDLEGGGGFNVMGLLHSLRRQLIPALGLGLLVSSLVALGIWFMMPVQHTAEAVLRVNRELSKGNASDYMIYKETQSHLIRSTFVINSALREPEINQLAMVKNDSWGRPRKNPVSWLSKAVFVRPDETELIQVTMQGWHKEQTKEILDRVLKSYQTEIINKERMEKVGTRARLRKQYQDLYDAVSTKSDQISTLAQQLGATDNKIVAQQQQMKINELNAARHELDRIRSTLWEAIGQYRLLEADAALRVNPSENQILDMLEQDPRYFQIVSAIEQYKDELEQMQGFVRPGAPDLEAIQGEIVRLERKRQQFAAEMNGRIVERIRNAQGSSPGDIKRQQQLQGTQIKNLQAEEARVQAIYDEKLSEVQKYGGANGELQARMNDLAALQKDMQTVRNEMQLLDMEIEGPEKVSIIQDANLLEDNSFFSKLVQVGGGWFISLAGVIACVSYWDYLGQRVNGEQDVTRSTRVIGTLPSNQRGMFGGKKPIDEAMKVAIDGIRTAIIYNRNHATQSVMVTSATGQEGRSTVASQLAVSMARAGKMTLLIDADFHNPQQQNIFGLQPPFGLSEMLRGEKSSDEAIVATTVENVWLLSAGRCDQQALQGLTGDQAKAVFQDFRDRFDMIILDASPVLTSPDALLTGQHVDSALLSVRRDVSQTPKVNAAVDRLTSVGVPLLGAIVNGSNIEVRGGQPQIAAAEEREDEQPALTNA